MYVHDLRLDCPIHESHINGDTFKICSSETYINEARQDRQNNTGREMIELQQAFSWNKYGNPLLRGTELDSIGIARQKHDHFFMQPYAKHAVLKRIITSKQEQKHLKKANFQEQTRRHIEGTRKLIAPPNWKEQTTPQKCREKITHHEE